MRCVLVVDDSAGVRDRLRELLTRDPRWQICEACDGPGATELLEETRVDAVVLDIAAGAPGSEGCRGIDLLRTIRKRAPQALLIVLTNHTSDAHRRECLQQGADYFFDKSRQFEHAIDLVLSC